MVYAGTERKVKLSRLDRSISRASTVINAVTGALLLILAVVKVAEYLFVKSDGSLTIVAAMVIMACGVAAQTKYRKNTLRAISMYALALGLSRVILSIDAMIGSDEVTIVMNLVMAIVGANLVLSGVSYYFGSSRRRSSMIVSTAILFALNLFMLCVLITSMPESDGERILRMFVPLLDTLIMCMLYMMFIWMLDSEEARYNSSVGKSLRSLRGIRDEYCIDKGSWVFEEVVENLINREGSLWVDPDDGGPVESEMLFKIRSTRNKNHVLVQKWKGDDRLYFSVRDGFGGTVITANRFVADHIAVENGHLHISNRDGIDIWLKIENREVHYEYR